VRSVSHQTDFDPQIVFNVINAETGKTWNCDLVGKVGELGCLQIRPEFHDVDPLDLEASVRYFISEYKAGRGWQWTSANCYAYASLFTELPRMSEILPNTSPKVGAVAIFEYPQKHIGIVEKLTEEGFYVKEANYFPGLIAKRFVSWNDPKLIGFYTPEPMETEAKGD
jgi:hypothetical protein